MWQTNREQAQQFMVRRRKGRNNMSPLEEDRDKVQAIINDLGQLSQYMGQLLQYNTTATASNTEAIKKVIEARMWSENAFLVLTQEIEKETQATAVPADAPKKKGKSVK